MSSCATRPPGRSRPRRPIGPRSQQQRHQPHRQLGEHPQPQPGPGSSTERGVPDRRSGSTAVIAANRATSRTATPAGAQRTSMASRLRSFHRWNCRDPGRVLAPCRWVTTRRRHRHDRVAGEPQPPRGVGVLVVAEEPGRHAARRGAARPCAAGPRRRRSRTPARPRTVRSTPWPSGGQADAERDRRAVRRRHPRARGRGRPGAASRASSSAASQSGAGLGVVVEPGDELGVDVATAAASAPA